MLEKIANALQKRGFELFSLVPYEEKIETDWQAQILSDLEQFIHERIGSLKKNNRIK